MSHVNPERLGRYAIKGLIGAGSMGVVYLGHDPEIDRLVAIKTVQKHLLESTGASATVTARFRLEARAAGRLSHPGIVTVYDVGEDDNCAFIAMEYVAGQSLRQYLARGLRFTLAETVSFVTQLLDALGEAHSKGVLHRDIKPGNLYVDSTGRLKVGDFGIARIEASQLTRTESVLGSVGYMAPEQYIGGELDRRVDLYSAGVVLYQLLSGRMPFAGTEQAVMYQVVYGEPDALCRGSDDSELLPYGELMRRALARQPAQRFESAAEFRQALERLAPNGWRQEPLAPRRVLPPAVPGANAKLGGGLTPLPVPTGWNEATLAGVEHELALILGPIAKILVRRMAREVSTLDVLRLRVAEHIPDPLLRGRFLGEVSAASSISTLSFRDSRSPPSGFRNSQASPSGSGAHLSPDDVERAADVLVQVLGPISKVLARRCAAGATTREQFVELILQQASPTAHPDRLRAQLWKIWL